MADSAVQQAILWISEQIKADPKNKLYRLIDEAAQKFDLSPLQSQALHSGYLEHAKKK